MLSGGTDPSDIDATTSTDGERVADRTPASPTGGTSGGVASASENGTEVDTVALLAEANTIAGNLDCASLSVSLTSTQRLELSGFVDNRETLRQLRLRLADIKGVKGVGGVVETHPRPFCSILELLTQQANLDSESLTPPWIQLDRASGRYIEGDRLMLTVTQTDEFDGYLYIDYVDSTGSLVHMLSTGWRATNKITTGKQVNIGTEGRYVIAPPHGRAMILAVATRQRLFRSTRPEAETADTYLQALAERLESLSGSGDLANSVSSFVFFTTSPKG